ncbi:ECF transporter S component [Vagococcus sp. BWB3-3]|uniref:Riboflavin transporter n=1 Tax=Vagococcus allomyrinae TaxID=2794353 RepID=A0A940SUC3_9ENTE|nr:ECF transporter S component [Vagococcus allomyrinae]MBP1040619.1 ECF transporter S component [Vagococcus allomyrinae]
MRRSKTQKMVGVAMLAAIGYLLMFLAFPVIPLFPYMKVDFSDIPILIGTYLFGPIAGITTAFLRSVIHFVTTGGDVANLIGDVTSFVASVAFVLPVYFITKKSRSKFSLISGLAVGVLSLTVVMSVMNYFVTLPLYLKVMNFDVGMAYTKYIVTVVVPFNLIKGAIISTVFLGVHAKLLPWLSKKEGIVGHQTKGAN